MRPSFIFFLSCVPIEAFCFIQILHPNLTPFRYPSHLSKVIMTTPRSRSRPRSRIRSTGSRFRSKPKSQDLDLDLDLTLDFYFRPWSSIQIYSVPVEDVVVVELEDFYFRPWSRSTQYQWWMLLLNQKILISDLGLDLLSTSSGCCC